MSDDPQLIIKPDDSHENANWLRVLERRDPKAPQFPPKQQPPQKEQPNG